MIILLAVLLPLICCDELGLDSIPTLEVIPTGPPVTVKGRNFKKDDQLLFVQAVWRHGDRAPVGTYPTDPHQESSWPYGWGELTALGMRQQYALGKLLRSRYINGTYNLLSSRYTPKEIYIRSTDVNRTLISAYSNLAGMFSDGDAGTDYPGIPRWPTGWTPIPVHTMNGDEDHVGNVFAPCPRADELEEELEGSKEFQKLVSENQNFLEFLSNKTGMRVDLRTIFQINDVTHIETIYNMSLPDWMTQEVQERMRNLTQKANEYVYGISKPYFPELIKLRGGSMLGSILGLMKHKLSCSLAIGDRPECSWMGPLKYYAYSAHDTTVAALLTTFGDEEEVIRGGLPKYTASVAVELWNLSDIGPAVRILFHGAFHHKYHTITHLTKGCPKNNEFCPLKVFEKRSLKFIPKNIEEDCKRHSFKNNRAF